MIRHNSRGRYASLKSELFYVQEGVVNDYAFNFVVPIPAHISHLRFSWYSRPGKQIFYNLEVVYPTSHYLESMEPPFFNISQYGTVPKTPTTFQVTFPCTGKSSAEIDVTIQLNVTGYEKRKEGLALSFRRKKFCLKDEAEPPLYFNEERKYLEQGMQSTSRVENSIMMVIAIICSVISISLLVTLVALLLTRKRKLRRGITPSNCRSMSNIYLRTDLIPFQGKLSKSVGSASYASITSYQKEQPNISRSPSSNHYHTGSTGHYMSNPVPTVVTLANGEVQTAINYTTVFSPFSIRSEPRGCGNYYESPAASTRAESMMSYSSQSDRPSEPLERIKRLIVPRFCLSDTTIQIEGAFSKILVGTFKRPGMKKEIRVIAKTVTEHASSVQKTLLLTEGTYLSCLRHRHILPPVAVCLETARQPVVIYSYPERGNLKRFLKSCLKKLPENCEGMDLIKLDNSVEDDRPPLHTRDIVDMAIHVTLGMLYLHRHGIIHKDLATRNCVVDDRGRVKIADSALSRDLYPGDYHCLGDNENRPIKWMSLEAIKNHEFSTASDVWSFGVLLWEMTTLAQQPYSDIDPFEMADCLQDGVRLQQPLNCPDELFAVMACCWLDSPAQRPTFMQLLACLQDFHSALGKYI
ncbi:tyrosine-protein kinase Drl-like isoform X2 [Artemia franciscana]|uniref:tyrosine-protein kinase Drl-like isoform X2 n=1 Tax=Artemia franciscana TaxID=6661 RepID=UPI0032DAAC31